MSLLKDKTLRLGSLWKEEWSLLGIFSQWSFLGHWIRIRIDGFQVEKLLSKAISCGICFKHMEHISETSMEADITAGDFELLQKLTRNKYRLTLINEGGIRFRAVSFKRKKLLICGIMVFIIFCAAQNLFIREVDVIGCTAIDENQVIACAREAGLYKGALKGFDAEKVQNHIYESFDKVVWVKVETRGGYAQVRLAEAQGKSISLKESHKKMKNPCHIVADCDCYVETVRTYRGVRIVEPGAFVRKGRIIISGKIPVKMSTYDEDADKTRILKVHADGEVIARVPYYYSFYLNHGEGKKEAEARVRTWIKENVPKDAQILNKSLNFQEKENIIKVYGVVETRRQVGEEKEIIIENNSNR